MKILAGILISLYLGLTLFGLYQYKAHNRSWGVKLVVWMSGLALLVGIGVHLFSNCQLFVLLPLFLVAAFCLAYFIGWRVIGGRFSGWKQHLIRGLAFAVCLGPLAAMGYPQVEYLDWWLTALPGTSFIGILKFFSYGLPGFFLVGAISFLVSAGQERWKRRRPEGSAIAMSRRVRLGYGLILLTLLPCVNWYVAGTLDLCDCVKNGQEGMLTYVLWSRPGSVNAWYSDGLTPLHVAARHGHTEVAKILLEAGADVHAKVKDGVTPLHWAAYYGHTKVVKILLKAGAKHDARNDGGFTPLHQAALLGHTEAAKILLKAGAEVNAKNKYGHTPLHLAALRGQAETIKLLLKAEAEVNTKTKNGFTPLHLAAEGGHTGAAKILLEAGAEVNTKDNWYGMTPLDTTKVLITSIDPKRQAECAQLLRKHGAKTGAELDAEAKQGKKE